MKILIATDSFKDSLSAIKVGEAIKRGIHLADSKIDCILFPLADGGEGTLDVLSFHLHGKKETLIVNDPLFRKIEASYLLSKNNKTAFIEMAATSGLELLTKEERNAMYTSSFGTGEIILDAISKGAKKIILAIGGSATNDAGIGMAAALGFRFLNKLGKELKSIGKNLIHLHRIESKDLNFKKDEIEVDVICDVQNPLYGLNGAAYIYAAQKGANEKEIKLLNKGLMQFAFVAENHFQKKVNQKKGAGAAGGMGAAAALFLDARLQKGIDVMMDLTEFEKHLKGVDLVITGEGKLDEQTFNGKLIQGICSKAKKCNIPVIAFCAVQSLQVSQIKDLGLMAAFSILNQPMSLEDSLLYTAKGLEKLAFNVFNTITF